MQKMQNLRPSNFQGFFSSGHLALITIAVVAGLITSSAAVVVT